MSSPRLTATAAVLRVLARSTPWLETELLGLSTVVRPGAVCIDAGAAAGIYTAVLSELAGPTGTVHSVEPLRFAYPPALRRLLTPGSNVVDHRVALGRADGAFEMRLPVRRGRFVTGRSFLNVGASGLGSNAQFADHVRVDVQATTLDAFCVEQRINRLDFIKADVEGAELDLLEGGAATIAGHRPALLLEIEERHVARYGRTAEEVASWLRERGYRMQVWRCGRWTQTSTVDHELRNHLFTSG